MIAVIERCICECYEENVSTGGSIALAALLLGVFALLYSTARGSTT